MIKTCFHLHFSTVFMAGLFRPKDGVATRAHFPAIHVFLWCPGWMPATSAGMTVEITQSCALLLDAALLFPLRLAAIAGDKGRVLRAEAAVALDHRLSAALGGIEGAFLLDAAADVLACAPGAFIDIAMPPAEQHALVLEQLRGGRTDAKAERRRNGQGCKQTERRIGTPEFNRRRRAQANGKQGENKAALDCACYGF